MTAASTRWAPTYVGGFRPYKLPLSIRKELLRLAKCPQSVEQRFIDAIETASGAYLAAKSDVKDQSPRKVRAQLQALLRAVQAAIVATDKLSGTADYLFSTTKTGSFGGRYPKRRLLSVASDVDRALREARQWANARLPDYPKLHLIKDVAAALRDIADQTPTATTSGALHGCMYVLLRALHPHARKLDDMTRSLRSALRAMKSNDDSDIT